MLEWLGFRSKINLATNLTVCLEQDEATGIYVAHFEQFPDTYAQGKTAAEATLNVAKALKAVWELEQAEKEQALGMAFNIPSVGSSKRYIRVQLEA